VETYRKNSGPFLQLDAHFTVVEASLRGYMKWIDTIGKNPAVNQTNVISPGNIFHFQSDVCNLTAE